LGVSCIKNGNCKKQKAISANSSKQAASGDAQNGLVHGKPAAGVVSVGTEATPASPRAASKLSDVAATSLAADDWIFPQRDTGRAIAL
jgi:hypothetical protein